MAESETYRRGREVRRRLLGDAYVEKIDRTTRTLVCVVSDAATGREPELAIHLRMALRQGWTQEELTEVLLHLSAYVGLPMVREALLAAKKVFAEVTTG